MAGRQARGGVDAIPGGHGYPLNAGSCLGDGNGGAGDGRPGLIFHPAGDLAGTRLGTGRQHADTPRARRRETDCSAVFFESSRLMPPAQARQRPQGGNSRSD